MKALFLALSLLCLTLTSFAGAKGNGGGIHHCPGIPNYKPELYDIYEGRARYDLTYNLPANETEAYYREFALKKLRSINWHLAKRIEERLNEVESKFLLVSQEIEKVPDFRIVLKDEGCDYYQLANWDDESGKIFVSRKFYNNLKNNSHRYGLKLHEAVYAEIRAKWEYNSEFQGDEGIKKMSTAARRIVANILSFRAEERLWANILYEILDLADSKISKNEITYVMSQFPSELFEKHPEVTVNVAADSEKLQDYTIEFQFDFPGIGQYSVEAFNALMAEHNRLVGRYAFLEYGYQLNREIKIKERDRIREVREVRQRLHETTYALEKYPRLIPGLQEESLTFKYPLTQKIAKVIVPLTVADYNRYDGSPKRQNFDYPETVVYIRVRDQNQKVVAESSMRAPRRAPTLNCSAEGCLKNTIFIHSKWYFNK